MQGGDPQSNSDDRLQTPGKSEGHDRVHTALQAATALDGLEDAVDTSSTTSTLVDGLTSATPSLGGQAKKTAAKRPSVKPHPRSSSFTNLSAHHVTSGPTERPRLYSKFSYDASMKPSRLGYDSTTSPQGKSPRLLAQQDELSDGREEMSALSMRPSSPARSQSASAFTGKMFSARNKNKSQLNLVTGAESGSITASKRRDPSSSAYNSRSTVGTASGRPGTGTRYYAQEKAYLKKIQHDTYEDYSNRTLGNVVAHSDFDSDSDDELDLLPREAMGLGGVGTSFDDEYTDNVTSYPFLEASYNHEEMENDESLPERLEWQAMLASVLTGEVVQSEKRRLKTTTDVTIKEDDLWIEIRARLCSRTFEAQKRKIEDARANVEPTFTEILQFKVSDPSNLDLTVKEVDSTLKKLESCEELWRSIKKVRASSALYRDPMFQRHVDALRSWRNITDWIFREIHLLQVWTGNEGADPTLPPDGSLKNSMMESTSLVEKVLKQEELMKVFNEKIKWNIGPVIQRARDAHLEFREEYQQIGLPVNVAGLEKLMKFPIKLIQEIVSLRLVYAKRMTNPTVMLVDQTIEDLSRYMSLALLVKERNIEYTSPVPDINWITYTPDSRFDKTVLDCVVFFFELSSSKFSDNSFNQAFRGFHEIDNFLSQYKFLEQVGRYVQGGEVVVAIQSW